MDAISWDALREALYTLWTPQNALLTVIALILLFYLWVKVRRFRRPREVFAFQTDRGEVFVTAPAVSDLIHKICLTTEGISKVSSRLTRRKGGALLVELRIHLRVNHAMRDVARHLEERLGAGLRRIYGFENIERIRTVVVGIAGQPDASAHLTDDASSQLTHVEVARPYRTVIAEEDPEDQSR